MKHHLSTYFLLAFGLAVVSSVIAGAGMGFSFWLDVQHGGPMHVGKGPNTENGSYICQFRNGARDYCGLSDALFNLLLDVAAMMFFGIIFPFARTPDHSLLSTGIHAAEFFIGVLLVAISLILVERLPLQRHAKYFYPVFVVALTLVIALVDFVLWR